MNDDDATDLLDRLGSGLPDSTPPTTLLTVGRKRRRRRRLVRGGCVVGAVAVLGGVALAVPSLPVWDESGPDRDTVAGSPDELAEAGGQPCPDVLPHKPGGEGEGFGTSTPASGVPDLPEAERGWVCVYSGGLDEPGPDSNGDYIAWHRSGEPVSLDATQLADAREVLDGLSPADAEQGCHADLGSRWLLVTDSGGDLTGIAVDDFGCRTVRMTDNPAVNEPGVASQPGTVSGALRGAPGLIELLEQAYGSFSRAVPLRRGCC